METSALPGLNISGMVSPQSDATGSARETAEKDIKQRFEQMLWAEMLSHAGLEKALTQGGGEAASSFSRYVVEAIAKDLAETHPMGLAEGVNLTGSTASANRQEIAR